eukprot:gene18998-22710_t
MSAGGMTNDVQTLPAADDTSASRTVGQLKTGEEPGGIVTTKSRDASGRFVRFEDDPSQETSQNTVTPGNSADELINIADMVETLAKDIPEDKRKDLAGAFEKMTKMQMDIYKQLNTVTSTNKELRSMYEDVKKDNKRMLDEREVQYGDMASQITDAINDIYTQYDGTPMDDKSKRELSKHLCGNNELVKTLRGLPAATVAMSAQRQLLDVASESKYKEAYSLLPPALRDGIKSYDTSCGIGRIVPDDFNGDVVGSKRQRIQ